MQTILTLLLVCSLMTGLITEALKKTVKTPEDEYSKNLMAGSVAVGVGVAVSAGYLVLTHTKVTPEIIVYIIILIVFSWLASMLGYDKIVQTINQMGKKAD